MKKASKGDAMKEKLYQLLASRSPAGQERYQALRLSGTPRWRAAPALLRGAFSRRESARLLPAGSSLSALSLWESPAQLVQRLVPFDVVSFDVFDTLLLRAVDRPQDAFALLGAKLGYPHFARLRTEAEGLARQRKRRRLGTGEVTLAEIWQELEQLTALSPQEGMAAEQEVEKALCRGNPLFLPVVKELRRLGKPLVLLSDMYLPAAFLEELVEAAGFGRFSLCLVSGEAGVSKGEGGLFDRLGKFFPPGTSFVHVGDNPHADGSMAKSRGIASILCPNVHRAGDPYRPKDLSPLVGSVYRGIVNGRLHGGLKVLSPLYEYGFAFGGLFALGYCRFIRQWADRNRADRLLFLSRDGEVLLQLYRRLYPEDPRPVYAYWSRLAAAKICAGLFPADYFRRFLTHRAGRAFPWSGFSTAWSFPRCCRSCAAFSAPLLKRP